MAKGRVRGYVLGDLIGSGGMGLVYFARHETLNRTAAVKILHKHLAVNASIRERFIQEARILAELNHENIVRLFDFTWEPSLCLIMEHVDGRGLDRMIGREVGPIPWEKALPLFYQVLDGIGYAHSMGVIHRDVKPANILVSWDGTVKITDLGIAKVAGQSGMTGTGVQLGTLRYESPEQILGARDVDLRSDIYSLGMTLYEMLAGKMPFVLEDDTAPYLLMRRIIDEEFPSPRLFYPGIPESIVEVVMKAVSKDPSNRYESCREMTKALENAVEKADQVWGSETELESGVPPSVRICSEKKKKRSWIHSVFPGAAAALVFGILVAVLRGGENPPHAAEMDAASSQPDSTSSLGSSSDVMPLNGVVSEDTLISGAAIPALNPEQTHEQVALLALSLAADVPGVADFDINGQRVAGGVRAISRELPVGQYSLRVTMQNMEPWSETVNLTEAGYSRTVAPARMDRTGRLLIAPEPWANVFVNGESVGQTPMPHLELPEGSYTVMLTNPAYEDQVSTVTVARGEDTTVRFTASRVEAEQQDSSSDAPVIPPFPISQTAPVTPSLAQQRGDVHGFVTLEVRVGTDGRVRDVSVINDQVGLGCGQAAVDAVRQWVFNPATQDGSPVEVTTTVQVRFDVD